MALEHILFGLFKHGYADWVNIGHFYVRDASLRQWGVEEWPEEER